MAPKRAKKKKKAGVSQLERTYFDPAHAGAFSGQSTFLKHTKQPRERVEAFLRDKESYTLHKPVRRKFPRRITYAPHIDQLWQADLADMSLLQTQNRGTRFLLTVIDVFSKFAFVRPLKRKTGEELTEAFASILKESGRKPQQLQTDKGTEFKNRAFQSFLAREDIRFYTSEDPVTKAAVVERFNRTLKGRLYRYMTHMNSKTYVNRLQDVVASYNATFHRSIGTQPRLVTPDTEAKVYDRLYGQKFRERAIKRRKPKFTVGDRVRLAAERKTFQRGFLPGWTREIFLVYRRENTHPYVYRVRDQNGERIRGTFYEQEMQKVHDSGVYRIERILKKKGRQALVRWAGYGEDFDSWIPLSSITSQYLN